MANLTLARLAERRANEGIGPQGSGKCQMWMRYTVQALDGPKWDSWLWQRSAKLAGEAFWNKRATLPDGAVVLKSSRAADTQVGDLLYRTESGGKDGHVCIRVSGNRVAENSSVHSGPNGAIGFRPLGAVTFDTIVRLPDPNAVPLPATAKELLAAVYGECADDEKALAALNRFRHHPDIEAVPSL